MSLISKRAAKAITNDLDRLAQLFESAHAQLRIPEKVAKDFSYRCDLLSDYLEKAAADDEDAVEDIVDGDVEKVTDPDEPYMDDKTEQDELTELGDMVDSGGLGKGAHLKALAAQLLRLADDDEADDDEADDDDEGEDKTAKKGDEDEDEDGDEDEGEDKKAARLAKHLFRLMRAAKGDEDDADDADDDDDGDKEASYPHGYSLGA
jgi:hypothetical protein